jgi:DNA-binding transcriptional MocR family regulator
MGLRDIILSGGLNGGERLPATRTLASEVGVSRTTALDAVDRLISEGLLESRIGAGTFVSHTLRIARPRRQGPPGPTQSRNPCACHLRRFRPTDCSRTAGGCRTSPRHFVTALPRSMPSRWRNGRGSPPGICDRTATRSWATATPSATCPAAPRRSPASSMPAAASSAIPNRSSWSAARSRPSR